MSISYYLSHCIANEALNDLHEDSVVLALDLAASFVNLYSFAWDLYHVRLFFYFFQPLSSFFWWVHSSTISSQQVLLRNSRRHETQLVLLSPLICRRSLRTSARLSIVSWHHAIRHGTCDKRYIVHVILSTRLNGLASLLFHHLAATQLRRRTD